MRRFTIAVIIICALSMIAVLYMEHDTRTFIKTLAPPVSSTIQQNAHTQEKMDPVSREETVRAAVQDPQGIVDKAATDTHVHQTDHPHPHEHTEDKHTRRAASDTLKMQRSAVASETAPQAKDDLKSDRSKPLEGLKAKLIEEHGDIPLVHRYIELRRKELNREPMTMDEVSALWEAIIVFNPHPENLKSYELIKKLSSQADPDRFEIRYDLKKGERDQ